MPITPFHFGPGAALHAVAPKRISFLAFCAANVLIDVEPLYYMLTHQFPLHRFLHTYIGATVVWIATVLLFAIARKLAHAISLPNWLGWRQLTLLQVGLGAALGTNSHIVLDSIMHADIRPLAPMSDANVLYRVISLWMLHMGCIAAGIIGLVIVAVREARRSAKPR